MSVRVREGQLDRSEDLLAEIDPRPYEAQLTQYKGRPVYDQALLDNTKIDLQRYRMLYQQDSIAQQSLAARESLVQPYEGTLKMA